MRVFFWCFSSFSGKLIWKISPLVLGEILGVFFNTLTSECLVSCSRFWEFATPNSNPVIWKTKNVLSIFGSISGIYIKFETFWKKKKKIVIANLFPKLETAKILLRPHSKKRCFRTNFDSEHVRASQTLEKSPWERFYHVFHHSERSGFGKCLP